jgi:hypothetical protein
MSNEFDLQRAINGEPIETIEGTPAEFIAYRPTADKDEQVIAQVGVNIMTYHANGKYYDQVIDSSSDLHMVSQQKQIDWAKLPVDTLIIIRVNGATANRYFSSFSDDAVHYFRAGMTSKTADYKSDVFTIHPSNAKIAPDQPWVVWLGGACPISDGLEYEVEFRGKGMAAQIDLKTSNVDWEHGGDFLDIIAYRLTGKVLDGWTLLKTTVKRGE